MSVKVQQWIKNGQKQTVVANNKHSKWDVVTRKAQYWDRC